MMVDTRNVEDVKLRPEAWATFNWIRNCVRLFEVMVGAHFSSYI